MEVKEKEEEEEDEEDHQSLSKAQRDMMIVPSDARVRHSGQAR